MRELIAKLPNDKALTELVRWTRAQPDDVARQLLVELLEGRSVEMRLAGLQLMKRVESLRKLASSQIETGLGRNDPSEIGHWLKSFADILGVRGLLRELSKIADHSPSSLVHAWYRLFILVSQQFPGSIPELKRLGAKIEKASPNFRPETLKTWRELVAHFGTEFDEK